MKKIIILGATGSIGQSTVEIAREYKDKIQVVGLSAHSNDKKLSDLGEEFSTNNLVLTGKLESSYSNISSFGMDSLLKMIRETECDVVVHGISGSSGLLPSIETILSGKDLALANKETMVMAGSIINSLVERYSVKLLPVDSEHSAIFHLLEGDTLDNISEIIITASGGAFRDIDYSELGGVTPDDALKHPTWSMGKKITIDSASMANKGLEVIEAIRLFNISSDKVKVLIHPQSYVHSMIRKNDNSIYAHISAPDMKLPIQNSIFYPEIDRVDSCYLDLTDKELTFSKPDPRKYKMLELAYTAVNKGEAYTIAYNAANEILVDAFFDNRIEFLDIPKYTEVVLNRNLGPEPLTIDEILEIDSKVRSITEEIIEGN